MQILFASFLQYVRALFELETYKLYLNANNNLRGLVPVWGSVSEMSVFLHSLCFLYGEANKIK